MTDPWALANIQCPTALRDLQGWLVWRFETVPGETRPRKVPYWVGHGKRHGKHGRAEDRERLVKFADAKTHAIKRGFDGVGFATFPEWEITALDFDGSIVDGVLDPDLERALAGTYAETSPSGNGVRAFVKGNLGHGHAKERVPYGIELFSSNGFVTFTGNVLPITEMTDAVDKIADPTAELRALLDARPVGSRSESTAPAEGTAPLGLTPEQLREALDVLPRDLHYDDWLMVGMALHHELGGEETGWQLWDEWSATSGKYSGPDYGRLKWDSFGRGGQRPTTVHRLVRMANTHGAHIEIAQFEADDFEVVTPSETTKATEAKPRRFARQSAAAFVAQAAPGWIVKDVVPQAAVMMVYGESKAGKSFVALDLFAAVARGVPWRGKRVKQGRVIYIAAEGAGGFRKRVKAYGQAHGVDLATFPFEVIPAAPNMLLRQDALDICSEVLDAGAVSVVVIDTLAQVMPGANESSSEGMSTVLAHCAAIHKATGALVVLVHHKGKDATKGARGWSGLTGAVDASLEVTRTPVGRMLRLDKQKDGEDGLTWGFDLEQVTVETDQDGEAVTSCVVCETNVPVAQPAVTPRGKWQVAAYGAVAELGDVGTGLTEAEVITAVASVVGGLADRKRIPERVRGALVTLVENQVLEFVDDLYRIA